MTSKTLASKTTNRSFVTFLIFSLAITFLMLFVDEGYYDLRWMKSFGNWIMFGVYVLLMLIGQLVFFNIILSRYSGKGKTAMSMIFGCILGAGSLIGVFYAMH